MTKIGAGMVAIAIVGLLAACRGKLLSTAVLLGPGVAETKFSTNGGKLVLWADTDGKWNGPKNSKMELTYDVEFSRAGASLGHVVCSTTERGGTNVCGSHSNIMGSHDADCEIELGCKVPSLPAGEVSMRVYATKGANVVLVRKMSLNVRAD